MSPDSGHRSASKSVWWIFFLKWCMFVYMWLLEPDQSTVAKRGLTNRANVHTPMWKSRLKTQHGRILAAIGHHFTAKIFKTPTRGSEATHVETRNSGDFFFFGLRNICIDVVLNVIDSLHNCSTGVLKWSYKYVFTLSFNSKEKP